MLKSVSVFDVLLSGGKFGNSKMAVFMRLERAKQFPAQENSGENNLITVTVTVTVTGIARLRHFIPVVVSICQPSVFRVVLPLHSTNKPKK